MHFSADLIFLRGEDAADRRGPVESAGPLCFFLVFLLNLFPAAQRSPSSSLLSSSAVVVVFTCRHGTGVRAGVVLAEPLALLRHATASSQFMGGSLHDGGGHLYSEPRRQIVSGGRGVRCPRSSAARLLGAVLAVRTSLERT